MRDLESFRPLPRRLHLNANLIPSGRHEASWRLRDADSAITNVGWFENVARIAESGLFDAVFLGDTPHLPNEFTTRPWHALDPILLMTAIARCTERIGLVSTASTSFDSPFALARRYASLDHISAGRAAWNIVTTQSQDAAAQFGFDKLPAHAEKYQRAHEFVAVARDLWDSVDDDAIVEDKASGRYSDPDRFHRIAHIGPNFSVRGPLNVPRSPQGRPVLFHAGDSPASRDFGSRWADAFFTVQRTLPEARAFYADIKARAKSYGRSPESILVLPGLYPVVGSTEEEARRRKSDLDSVLDIELQRQRLARLLNVDVSDLKLDELFANVEVSGDGPGVMPGVAVNLVREAEREALTVREVLLRNPFGGHRLIVGTPERIADEMQAWLDYDAADGFNLNMDVFPSGLALFVDHVVPELQRRNIFRKEYEGSTLRENMGLPRPLGGFSKSRQR